MPDSFDIPYCDLLTEEQVSRINNNSNLVTYKNKDIIFKQNTRTSHIMFIKKGLVKVYKEGRNDRNYILKIAKPGEYIGLLSIFGDEIFQYSSSAINDTEICFIDINAFNTLLSENSDFSWNLLSLTSREGLYIFQKLQNQAYKQLPGRIADVILYFSEHVYGSTTFRFPITRKELAEFAGTTKESFIRTLTEFKNDKIIRLTNNEVEIISKDIIKTLSNLG